MLTHPSSPRQAQQIATLQGLGRASVDNLPSTNNMAKKAKRDLAGFDRALQFAEVALTKGPDIQLGTGAEGSGVGIIVDNQPTATTGESCLSLLSSPPKKPFIWAVIGHGSEADGRVDCFVCIEGGEQRERTIEKKMKKREEGGGGPRRRAKVTTMFVKRGVPAGEYFSYSMCPCNG